jgi:RNA polymerase sigma-70 factor (ECF subfamily)
MSVPAPQTVPSPDDASEQDRADMARLVAGHDLALNDLMERHGERLFHYLIRCLQNENDAADLSQEIFVRIYQHREKFDPRQKFVTWLYAIASNLVRDYYRQHGRHPQVSLDAADGGSDGLRDTLPGQKPSPSEEIQAEERADIVRRAVAELPEELRAPLILAEYEELSQAEIGEILGCTAKAVETRIYRARQQLRAKLNKLFS